jgi:hypothetical protein
MAQVVRFNRDVIWILTAQANIDQVLIMCTDYKMKVSLYNDEHSARPP